MTKQPVLLATFKQRVFAFILDLLLILSYFMISILINRMFHFPLSSYFSHDPMIAQVLGFCWVTLPVSLYFFLFEFKRGGDIRQTIHRDHLIHHAHKRLKAKQILIRTVVKFLPWELSHFVIWRFRLPTAWPDWLLYSTLCIVYLVILINLWLMVKRKNDIT